jgi:outer membrane immunogenic protein
MRFLIIPAIMISTGISAASAADIARPIVGKEPPPPPPAPVYNWSGFYLGANVGLGFGRSLTNFSAITNSESQYLGNLGVLGGGQIGYNIQWDKLVVGAEADIQDASLDDSRTCMLLCTPQFNRFAQFDQKLGWFGTVRGRIGLADGPVLSYFTGGLAYGEVETNLNGMIGIGARGSFSLDETRTGWTIGSGIEAALGGNWTAKLEYLYLDLGTQTAAAAFGPATTTLSSEIHEQIVRAGLNYRIGAAGTYAAVPVANWAGFYIGGNAGAGAALNKSSLSSPNSAPPLVPAWSEQFNVSPTGFVGGGQIGYNWQTANWVYGLEADIQGSGQGDDKTCVAVCGPAAFGFAAIDQRLPWFGTVRGRIGYSVGSSLFYATGGLAYGEVKTRIADLSTFVVGASSNNDFSHTSAGWTVGAGLEHPFSWLGPNWTAKVEYLFADLGSTTDSYTSGTETRIFTTHVQNNIFRAGLNYHFDSPVVAKD